MKLAKVTRCQWVTKHVSRWCGVGKMMHCWKEWSAPDCPCCGQFEDAQHVWLCQGPLVATTWDSSIAALKAWMMSQETQPNVCTIICDSLLAWRNGMPANLPLFTFHGLGNAVASQNKIGWQALLEGCPSLHWSEVQQRYYAWLGSRRSGRRWVTSLIQKLWDVAWDLWDHRNKVVHLNSVSLGLTQDLIPAIHSQLQSGASRLAPQDRALFAAGYGLSRSNCPTVQVAWVHQILVARD